MTETQNAKYKFKEHIINLSYNKNNYDDALKEWEQMPKLYKKLHKGSCKCICQHILKYYYFIHNKKTHKTITVGKECYKKFKFYKINRDINEIYQNFINKYLQGEYENIEDVDYFSINIKQEIEKDLKDRYESNITNINVLNYLKTNIIELIEDYNFTDLEELKNLIIQTITVLEQKKFKEEQIKKEQIKQKIEKELKDRYESNITNINELNNLKTNIIELIEDYNFTCLEELKNLIIETINVLEQKKIKEEQIKQKIEKERIKKETIEREERIKKETIEREERLKIKINEKQIIDNNITLYNNNIEKWKLMTDKKEINENDDDYNKRIIYTKNGPLKIKDIILLSEIKIDKDIEDKIRHIGYIEDGNDCYMDLDKPWFIHYIDYKEFIKCYINKICYLNIKFNILSKKIYNI